MVSNSSKFFINFVFSLSLFLQPLSLKAMDTEIQSQNRIQQALELLNKFEGVLKDGQVDEIEIQEISQNLANYTYGVLNDRTLSEKIKKTIILDVVNRFGKVLYQFAEPFDDPIRVPCQIEGPLHKYLVKGQVILLTLLRDVAHIPVVKKDAYINKMAQVPIQAFIDIIDSEFENINESPSKREVLDFYNQLSSSMVRIDPYAHRHYHGSMYSIYLGMTLYLALIDRPDWVGLVTMDFNYWSPLFSSVSLAGLSGYLTYVRYVSSGRGVLKKYNELNKKIHYLEQGVRPSYSESPSIITKLTSISRRVTSFCESVLSRNSKN